MMMMWLRLKRNPRVKKKSESISPDVESENASITNTIVSETDTDMNKKEETNKEENK